MRRLAWGGVGVVAALALGEGLCYGLDEGAFPHFNGFVTDPVLGVRLVPGHEERLAYGGGPVTTARVGPDGWRVTGGPTAASLAPSTSRVVVVGDSQVFGLGVEDDQTASAQLSARLGRPVTNAGVPTWGPEEYAAILPDLLAHHPSTVIVVIDFANDLAELGQPNPSRHQVLDGWAVRGSSPPSVTPFPGRGWLFGSSHLGYAVRGAASTALELLTGTAEADAEADVAEPPFTAPAEAPPPVEPAELSAEVQRAVDDLTGAEDAVIAALVRLDPKAVAPRAEYPGPGPEDPKIQRAIRSGVRDSDVVRATSYEEDVTVYAQAGTLAAALRLRKEAPERLAAWGQAHPERAAEAQAPLDALEAARVRLRALDGAVVGSRRPPSVFRGTSRGCATPWRLPVRSS